MLELNNITKIYKTADEDVKALKGINIKFREAEFVSILGQSGCGKTTLLNIIGGLDRYTSGDLIINGKSTKDFKDRDWDSYRNHSVGFVFQSYNLISHQTVISNVELALTIAGISKKERRKRAIKALEDVGLKDQINKKPNQLSGGQMQRVAIARALVNNLDIILADEPTGALDTKTSVQIMEILKKISKDKLILMVTHNPELAQNYSSRIIRIVDGVTTEDSNPITKEEIKKEGSKAKNGKTSMKFWTAFRLSLNNLLTKKGRTVLISFAGSIGIIGIALIQAMSNGFQSYVNHIQEDTLTSYPLTIMQETTDIESVLLSMTTKEGEKGENGTVKEEQLISTMLSNISTNDLKSLKKYLETNYDKITNDVSSIEHLYSVEPMIYTTDATGKIAKLNPNNIFSSAYSSSIMSSYSSFASVYSQMRDDKETLNNSYDVLAGNWPQSYNEMVIVLKEPNRIPDLLVYSLGLRENDELKEIVNKIMSGEKVNIKNEPLTISYDELMKLELKLILPTDLYKHNSKYDLYENMIEEEKYVQDLYDNAIPLKIVGIVSAKEGINSMTLNTGVGYTSELIDYIIDYSSKTDIVKKQIANDQIDIISGNRFDAKKNDLGLDFTDIISIDNNKLQSAFNININQETLKKQTEDYMNEISSSVTTDIIPAKEAFNQTLDVFSKEIFNTIIDKISLSEIEKVVDNYLAGEEQYSKLSMLENNYVIPKDAFKTTYAGILKGLLQVYITSYYAIDQSLTENQENPVAIIHPDMVNSVITNYISNIAIEQTSQKMASVMTEAVMKKEILLKVGELTSNLTNTFASAFNVDQNKIADAFKMKMTEEEITRIVTAMMSKTETNAKTNLISLGYQDKEVPTYSLFYFKSFDGKENFMDFIDSYNDEMEKSGQKDKVINYTDTTGILMNSVKTIVDAVTYVLIAFVSISLVVSSIMIGIITYISVYERTKEIGILRAIGASKRNISSIFNAETFIIGLLSGLFGIGITYGMIPIINKVLHYFIGNIPLSAKLDYSNAIILVILSIILTLIGGLIPAKMASKKDPVIALRTE